jgi:hypothetical protein
MITNNFNNYFRLLSNKALTAQETLTFFLAVNEIASSDTSQEESMLYRIDSETNKHCYDIRLLQNPTVQQAEEILNDLKTAFLDNTLEYTISE